MFIGYIVLFVCYWVMDGEVSCRFLLWLCLNVMGGICIIDVVVMV